MDANVINELKSGLNAAYINGSVAANLAYKPVFVSNNPEDGKKVISSVEDELLRCDQFQISVAFITMGGVTPLLQTLKELEKKGVKGQILTTNYLNFSEPRALKKCLSLLFFHMPILAQPVNGIAFWLPLSICLFFLHPLSPDLLHSFQVLI